MKVLLESFRIQSTVAILWIVADVAVTTKNELIFERLTCTPTPKDSPLKILKCSVRHIDRKFMKVDVSWNITRPVYDAWMHGVTYYKFNGLTYSKFPIDLWENVCDWMAHKKSMYILEWTFGRILKYTNFNHSCPFFGHYTISIRNISMDHFEVEPLVPSGRYRLDVDFTEGDRKVAGGFQLFYGVSDFRLEVI